MKNIKYLSLFLLAPIFLQAAQLWVVGENYVAFSKDGKNLQILKDLTLSSTGIDREQCTLWGISNNKQLVRLSPELKVAEIDESATILSDVTSGRFYTRTLDAKIERRNGQGEVLGVGSVVNAESITQIHSLNLNQSNRFLALHLEPTPNRLWFSFNEENSATPQNFMVSEGRDLWGKAALHLDEAQKQLWVGYSKSTPKHSYTPFIDRFDLSGKKQSTYQWNEKGLFFDACLQAKASLLVARDLPSPQFTVPVYSFFEHLNPAGTIQKGLELETNLLVDSMACEGNRVYYLTHSILSGSKSTVFEWAVGTNNGPTALFQLPSGASKLYSCPVK